jgi:hypothetical protein
MATTAAPVDLDALRAQVTKQAGVVKTLKAEGKPTVRVARMNRLCADPVVGCDITLVVTCNGWIASVLKCICLIFWAARVSPTFCHVEPAIPV